MKAEIFIVVSVAQANKGCKSIYNQYIVMVGLVRSWKQSVLPTQLYLFHMASDRSFAKMCKEQHPLVCQRWR